MVHVHPAAGRCSNRLPKSHLSGLPLHVQDVVVQWVLRPGNYQRWRQGRKKKVAREILAELEAVGRRGHDATDVVCMVQSTEKQYVNLARWIQKNEIRASDLLRGDVDEKARSKAKRICPSYCDLVPVLREFNFDTEVPSSSSSSPSSSSSAIDDNAKEDKEAEEDDVTEVEANEDKDGIVAPEEVGATAGHKRPIEEISQYRPLSSSAKSLTKRGLTLHRARSQLIACKLDYEMASKRELFNTEQAKRRCAVEIEHCRLDGEKWKSEAERYRAEMMQARMEAERARTATEQHLGEVQRDRYDMTLRVDGVTSRHVLAAKGVAPEEIDQVLPL